jgi:glutamate 5-kinase
VLISNLTKGTIKQDWIDSFCADVKTLTEQEKRIVIVSSGGVALGALHSVFPPICRPSKSH